MAGLIRGALVGLVVWAWVGVAAGQAVPLAYQGQDGVWLPLSEAREAVACLIDRESQAERLRLLTESLSIADTQIEDLRATLDRAQASLEASLARTTEAESERDAWYRSPFLWTAIGAILGAGISIAAILGAGA